MPLTVKRDQNEQLVKVLKALADETRLKLVQKVARGEASCADLSCDFDLTGPTMSHHLKILSECGLITRRKEGQYYYNTLNQELYNNVLKVMKGMVK